MTVEATNTAAQQVQTAENATEAQQTAETAAKANQTAGEQEKTFTQAEVNGLIQSRLERERKGQPTKEELAAFHKWQDEQKTAEQKHADEIKKAQDAQSAAEQKAADLEARLTAFSKGVKAEAVEDVVALAKVKVSDSVTLEQAIDSVVAKYPSFKAQSVPVTTGTATSNNDLSAEADEAKARAAMGLPPKK